jgi:hypothetical protein
MSFWNGHRWEAQSPPAAADTPREGRVKRLGAAALEGALITALVFGLIAGTAFAGKGGRGGSGPTGGGTISLAPLVVDSNGNGTANWGDTVTFNISTTATSTPWVNVQCSQGGALVYDGLKAYWYGSLDPNWNFILKSGGWQAGAADCVAYLDTNTRQGMKHLASTAFHVDP